LAHTFNDRKRLTARVRRIGGQVRALEAALQEEKDCNALLQQIAAVRGAVNGLLTEVLEGHLREHLGPQVESPRQRQRDLDGVVAVLKSYLR
jgi:DNA-binding FrmR family transcriptional regulator